MAFRNQGQDAMSILKGLVVSARPKQWVKNSILYAGWLFSMGDRQLIFSHELGLLLEATYGFIVFCLFSASIYLFNDLLDAGADRLHPKKRNRPIASGIVPSGIAGLTSAVLALTALVLAFTREIYFGGVGATYLILFVAYTLALKKVPILDSMVIAMGFVMRAVAGALIINVEISIWLVICTFSLALFLGFAKRYSELNTLGENAGSHRLILSKYSLRYLELLLIVCSSIAVITYALWALSPRTMANFGGDVILTMPLVIFGVFRYIYLVMKENKGDDPSSVLFSDIPLLATLVLWIGLSAFLLVVQPHILKGISF